MRPLALVSLLVLAACGGERESPQQAQQREESSRPLLPELEPPPPPTAQNRQDSGDAAATLKLYYSRIGSGDYDSAMALRSGESGAEARRRFADAFKAYETYRTDVGTPSEPVQAKGWTYVEVPVMIHGTFRGGKPFTSAGSVTLRRATGGPEAGTGWRINTG
jgi:hypothetical protein